MAICLAAPTVSAAETLIRCPDWKSFIVPQPVLNKTVKRDFTKRISKLDKTAQKPLDLTAVFKKPIDKSKAKTPITTTVLSPSKVKLKARPNPPPKAIPVWKARKGMYLIDAVQVWAKKAGYQTIIAHKGDWRFQINYTFEGGFKTNLKEVVKGFGTSGLAPKITIYGNKVIKVGT